MKTPGSQTVEALGHSLRGGQLSCDELTRSVLTDIDHRDGRLASLVGITQARALTEAAEATRDLAEGRERGPLHGIPYVVKELFDVAGEPTTAGTPLLTPEAATRDAVAIRRLSEAGAVLVGRARSGPLAATILGINHAEPTPRNPWRASVIPGGSSSGSAVAVAAGLVPFALGSDTGGSVRVPAALCGIVGFQPTFGRAAVTGMRPLAPSLDTVGLFARTVEGVCSVTEVLQAEPIEAGTGVAGLRLGLCETLFLDDVEADVSSAVHEAARLLRDLGAEVRRVELPEFDELHQIASETSLIAAEAYPRYRAVIDHPESDWVMHWLRRAVTFAPERVEATRRRVAQLAVNLGSRIRDLDAILAPTTPRVAPRLDECDTPATHGQMNALLSRNTRVGNLAGWCGLSLPCGYSSDGLPIGLLISGAAHRDATVLRVGKAYQAATSWTGEPAPMEAP